jgi:hypothetical protein
MVEWALHLLRIEWDSLRSGSLSKARPYTLIAAKSKVAPLPKKSMTIPRLELLSNLMATMLGPNAYVIRTGLITRLTYGVTLIFHSVGSKPQTNSRRFEYLTSRLKNPSIWRLISVRDLRSQSPIQRGVWNGINTVEMVARSIFFTRIPPVQAA